MKGFLKKYWLNLVLLFWSLIVSLMWTAMRVNYAGISKALGAENGETFFVMYSPVILLVIIWLVFAYGVIGTTIFKNKKRVIIPIAACDLIFSVLIGVVIALGSKDYMSFIMPKFWKSLGISFGIIVFLCLIFVPIKNSKKGLIVKSLIIVGICASAVLIGYQIKPNSFTYDSNVYVVEDEYQIVFSTNDSSTAWVEIDGENYYDLYAGSMKSKDNVHKICVPQEKLDKAKKYTIYAEQIIYRGPFGGYKGEVISKTHEFRPVDTSDGFDYFTISDIHGGIDGAIKAASYHENMDMLIIGGDLISMVETYKDANYANLVAFKITKGEIPILYNRGNHEIKGSYAEDLYKFVGSKDGNFYYTYEVSKEIGGVVLDIGEDHDDDWWEYYGTAQFDLYHEEQTKMLEQLVENRYLDQFKYKLVTCHIPVQYVNYRHNHEDVKKTWTELLNKLDIDILLCGHQHELNVFEPGAIEPNVELVYNKNYKGDGTKTYSGYMTDFNFVGFIVGRNALKQKGDTSSIYKKECTGLYVVVDFKNMTQTCKFTNSNGEVVPVCNMFGTDELREEFIYNI